MGRHTIPITNGKGSIRLVNGNYKVSAVVEGYNPDSIEPKNVTIVEGTNTYTFTIKANGTLTLHVTDTGNPQTGVQVIGAKFVRTDSTGNILSEEVITDTDGNAKFSNIPFATSGNITIYYKQITSDGGRSQFLQYALHLAAGQLFEAGTHDRHAIQEQRNTAQQRGDVCNVHKTMLLKSSYCSIAQDGCA